LWVPAARQLLLLLLLLVCWRWLRAACAEVSAAHKHGSHMDVVHVLLMLLE
jgi:ABC-type Mn2+/Zn2+ transport system permease subunit